MQNVCKSVNFVLFADDSIIETIGGTKKEIESDFEATNNWLQRNKLVLNLKKNISDDSEVIIRRHDILPELQ